MADQFGFRIPSISGEPIDFVLSVGDILYVLGANGSGKSGLVQWLYSKHQSNAKRISAHRQTSLTVIVPELTPSGRKAMERTARDEDRRPHSRYREWSSAARPSIVIYDLIDANRTQNEKIAGLVRSKKVEEAKREARRPSPIDNINEVMRLSNLSIKIGVEEGQIIVWKNGGPEYKLAELSDGERNAFLIAAEVLTAKSGTLILIDEPERHLHRSIVAPLLKLLFDRRPDCAFVVSTHELMLPVQTPKASTLLLRGCKCRDHCVEEWSADLLDPGVDIGDDLRSDILGSRRKIIFVEGTAQSLDAPLYSLLFPQVSIVPKEGCRSVIDAVRGLRGASGIHWVSAWGIIDNDQRSAQDVARLKKSGVWALSHYSVESLYYHEAIIKRIAERQAGVIGDDSTTLINTAIGSAIAAARDQRDHLVEKSVLRSVRNEVMGMLPNSGDIEGRDLMESRVDVAGLRAKEQARFDELISTDDWCGLLTRYPLRESPAFGRVVEGLKLKDRDDYRSAVLKLLRDEPEAIGELRSLLDDLYESVTE